jgi:hypothetical protein
VIFVLLNSLCRYRLPRHAILFANPLAEIDKLAAFGTKRPEGIILRRSLSIAGRALFHEPKAARLVDQRDLANRAQQPLRAFDQNSSINKFDRTLAAHCIQANGDALAS